MKVNKNLNKELRMIIKQSNHHKESIIKSYDDFFIHNKSRNANLTKNHNGKNRKI